MVNEAKLNSSRLLYHALYIQKVLSNLDNDNQALDVLMAKGRPSMDDLKVSAHQEKVYKEIKD